MKIDKNKIRLSTPRLSGIPVTKEYLEREKEITKELREEGIREVTLCCKNTINAIQQFLEVGITESELQILINSLNQHPLDRFSNNKYKTKGLIELDNDKLIDEINQIASLFDGFNKSELFLEIIYELVQKENDHPDWAITLVDFNNRFTKRINRNKIMEKEVFVTYSWDSEEHKIKVLSFTNLLRDKGFHADIDRKKSQESTSTDFTKMMHQGITDYNKVVIVLTEGYKERANGFKGGVGNEYQMIIKDIEQNPKKYVLVCFGQITDNIFPTALKDREVINVDDPKNHNVLFAKLQDEDIIKFSKVAPNKPLIESLEIPKFGELIKKDENSQTKNNIEISEVKTTVDGGSYKSGGLYFITKHIVAIAFENISQVIIENCLVQVKIPEKLTPYDDRMPIKSGFKLYKKKIDDKIYPTESNFVELGNIEISNKTADEAFASSIIVSVIDGVCITEKEYLISDIVYSTDPLRGYQREKLTPERYHDKNTRQ